MSDRERDTKEIELADIAAAVSEPPTAVTNVADIRALLRGDQWTLTVLTGERSGRIAELSGQPVVVGRGVTATIRQPDNSLSREHAAFVVDSGEPWVRDLRSTNGTFVDGVRVEGAARLSNGARVQLGQSTAIRVQIQGRQEIEAARAVYEASIRDALTGVSNRRHLDDQLETELGFARRRRAPLSVLMVDIDHFKKVNDTHGHAAGDATLRAFAALLAESVRREDLVARYGGEEFTVILRDSGASAATILAERIRTSVEAMVVDHDGHVIRVTTSVGIATHDTTSPYADAAAILAAADGCLYRAKRAGRNVVVSETAARSVPPRG